MNANALQLEAARRRAVPLHFNFVARAMFKVAQPIRCRLRAFLLRIRYITLWPWTLTPWPWPLPLNICNVPAVPWWNSVWNLSSIGQSAAKLLQFDVWPYDLEHVSVKLSVHEMWRFFHANTSCHAMTVCTKFDRNRTILGWVIHGFANFCSHDVSLWPWPLTPWPWTFAVLQAYVSKPCVKFERNRTSAAELFTI